jgi:small subunit ribosomal protein S21
MIIIEVKDKNSLERSLKKYKRKFDSIGIIKELRNRKNFKKKSVKRREQIKKAIYVQKKFNTEE